MSSTEGFTSIAIAAVIGIAAGVLIAQTRAEQQQKQFIQALAKTCNDKVAPSRAMPAYDEKNDTFKCVRVMERTALWIDSPVFSHPLRGVTQ